MSFLLGKFLFLLARPSSVLLMLVAAGHGLSWVWARRRAHGRAAVRPFWRRAAAGLLVLGWTGLAGAIFLPAGYWLTSLLENRFPQPRLAAPPAGLILLGGGQATQMAAARGGPAFTAAAGRTLEFLTLMARYPDAAVILSGGDGAFPPAGVTEAEILRPVLEELGFGTRGVIYEDRSRTTAENAAEVARLAPQPLDGKWLLVTSARHMPRAMAAFRAQGLSPTAYPVDFKTAPGMPIGADGPGARLAFLDEAAHEFLGLAWYRFTGKTRELWPAP